MSAIRLPGPDGHTILVVIDDGCSPSRSSKGIRGATFDNPILGSHAVGVSHYAGNRKPRPGAHSPKVRP